MKSVLLMLLVTASLLLPAERLNPGQRKLIMTDEAGMPLDDGTYSVTFRVYDSSREGMILSERTASVESKNGVCRVTEDIINEYLNRGLKEIWISLQIEGQPENKFRTRIFLEPVK